MNETTVAVDAMGGDHGPAVVIQGALAALQADPDLTIRFVGTEEVSYSSHGLHARLDYVRATQVVDMDEKNPGRVTKSKPDSSMVVGCREVADGYAEAFFTVGNTGAAMAVALFTMKRIPGVRRPALAAILPTKYGRVILLDVGANADCQPEYLVQFAHMGAAYSAVVSGVLYPEVALLSNGEESSKGSKLIIEVHELMRDAVPNFIGNIEGHDILSGDADVIVTDGLMGNVALKTMEGTAKFVMSAVRDVMTATLPRKLVAVVLRSGFLNLKQRIDPATYGGAPLLGVNGVCIVGHGSSSAEAVESGILLAASAARNGLVDKISNTVTL